MRALLWARVSDPRRADEDGDASAGRRQSQQDVENQLIALREAAARLGWEVVGEKHVEGSAWNKDLPEKEEVLEQVRRGGVDVIAVWSIDRWSRKQPYLVLQEVVQLEEHLGVHLYSLKEPWLSTTDPGLRQVLITLFSWIAEYESRKRSERVKAAVASKRARVGNLGQNPKWGRGKIAGPADVERILALRAEHPEWSLKRLGDETGFSRSTVWRLTSTGTGDGAPPPVSKQ